MKLLFLLFASLSLYGMQAPSRLGKKATARQSALSFSQLSTNLLVALKNVDVPSARSALKDLENFKKNTEEFKCLEGKAGSYLQALTFHIQEQSKATAHLVIHIEGEKRAITQSDPQKYQNVSGLSPQIIQKHANVILLQEMVINFFTAHWREQDSCLYAPANTPPLP